MTIVAIIAAITGASDCSSVGSSDGLVVHCNESQVNKYTIQSCLVTNH